MKYILVSLVFVFQFITQFATGQTSTSDLVNYNWDENRSRYQLTKAEEESHSVVLLSKTITEYIFENEAFVQYTVDHFILRVNSADAIESSNKINISMLNTIEVVNIKARSISKNGTKINLDKNNIKEIKEDEENSASKIFAIEGVEIGSEIEYFYVKKTYPKQYGYDIFQYSSPVKEAYFQLITPSHLLFKFKGYNGYPIKTDTVINEKRFYTFQVKNIPELKNEGSSNYIKNQMRMEYKMAVNTAKSNKELYTWNDLAQNQHEYLFALSSKETKSVEKLFKELKISSGATSESKIKTIENYIKSNILIQDIYKNDDSSLDRVISNKFGNDKSITKLYIALFKQAGIENQLVITSERDKIPFDGNFESWRLLNNYLFYFPATEKYLSPEEQLYRYPLIPYSLTYTEGLFLKPVSIGGYESYIPSVKFIPAIDAHSSSHNIDANIEFVKDMEEIHLNLTCSFKGYFAVFTQPYYSQLAEDNRQKMLEDLVKDMTKDTKYIKLTAENTEPNLDLIENPFKVIAEVEGSALIEKAGNKVLLKVGEVIGRQVEMYQENKRVMEVEDEYNREFIRNINIKIPEGYAIKNLNDINLNHSFEKEGEPVYKFISSYTVKDNLLVIHIDEVYKEITCSLANFEKYRKVVNAAADFNKLTLVFEKI